jgi:hypothetical protein
VTAPSTWRLFGWTVVFTVIAASLNPFSWAYAASVTSGLPIGETLQLRGLLILNSLALAFTVVCAAGVGQTSRRSTPALAGVILSFLFMLLILGWVVPATNHLLRIELSTLDLQAPARVYLSARVVAGSELPLHELLSKAIVERNTAFGAQWIVSERLVLMLAAPAGFLLGIAVRNRLTGRTSWRIAQCAGAASLILGAIAGRYFWPLLSPIVPWAVAVRLERLGVVSWLGLALVCIAVVVLGRSVRIPNQGRGHRSQGMGPGTGLLGRLRRTLNSGRTRDFGRTLDPGRTPDPGRRTPD